MQVHSHIFVLICRNYMWNKCNRLLRVRYVTSVFVLADILVCLPHFFLCLHEIWFYWIKVSSKHFINFRKQSYCMVLLGSFLSAYEKHSHHG